METLKLARTRNEQKQILKLIQTQRHTYIHTNTNTENLYKSIYIYYRYRISDVTMERRTDLLLYRIEGSDGCNGRTQVF